MRIFCVFITQRLIKITRQFAMQQFASLQDCNDIQKGTNVEFRDMK